MRKLTSFKYNEREQKVALAIRNDRGNEKVDVTRYESNDAPKPELERALQQMRKHLMDICELPEEWADRITIRGVSIRHGKDGRVGLVIRGIRELEYSKTPLAINSPFAQEEWMDEEEGGEDDHEGVELSVFGPDCAADLKELERLVLAYFDGDRQQLVLFRDDSQDQPAETPEPVGVES